MPTPGVDVITRDSPPPRTAPTDTGVWFVTGLSDKGPEVPVLITSLSRFVKRFGERQSFSVLYDALQTYFEEGGNKVYVSRELGPAAAAAKFDLVDAVPAATLRISALDKGGYGNSLRVQVVAGSAGGTFVLVISHATLGELERSPDLVDKPAAIAWAANSDNIRASDLAGTGDPAVVAATPLVGGTDDRTNATDAQQLVALNRFRAEYGPGQVSSPGRTSDTAHTNLLDHAKATNRIAYLDAPDTTSKATLLTNSSTLRDLDNARYGGLFGPWYVVPGLVPSSVRRVPASAVVAGLTAQSDALNDPGTAPAGDDGQTVYPIALGVDYNTLAPLDYEDLNAGSVNMGRITITGAIENYGFRTLVRKENFPNHWRLSDLRALMAIRNLASIVAEHFVFAQIDGQGLKLAELEGQMSGMLLRFYDAGMLYGATPNDAFNVNVGADVNPPDQLENGEVRCVLSLRVSPYAEHVTIEVSKRAITEAVA